MNKLILRTILFLSFCIVFAFSQSIEIYKVIKGNRGNYTINLLDSLVETVSGENLVKLKDKHITDIGIDLVKSLVIAYPFIYYDTSMYANMNGIIMNHNNSDVELIETVEISNNISLNYDNYYNFMPIILSNSKLIENKTDKLKFMQEKNKELQVEKEEKLEIKKTRKEFEKIGQKLKIESKKLKFPNRWVYISTIEGKIWNSIWDKYTSIDIDIQYEPGSNQIVLICNYSFTPVRLYFSNDDRGLFLKNIDKYFLWHKIATSHEEKLVKRIGFILLQAEFKYGDDWDKAGYSYFYVGFSSQTIKRHLMVLTSSKLVSSENSYIDTSPNPIYLDYSSVTGLKKALSFETLINSIETQIKKEQQSQKYY